MDYRAVYWRYGTTHGIADSSPVTIIAGFALWTLGEMLLTPIAPAVAAARASPKTQSSYQGMLSIAQTAGQTIGPAIGVFAYSLNASLPWWGCGIGGMVSVTIIIWSLHSGRSA